MNTDLRPFDKLRGRKLRDLNLLNKPIYKNKAK
jgi:hypothetical protein